MYTACNCSLLLGHKEEGGMKSQQDILRGLVETVGDKEKDRENMKKLYTMYKSLNKYCILLYFVFVFVVLINHLNHPSDVCDMG